MVDIQTDRAGTPSFCMRGVFTSKRAPRPEFLHGSWRQWEYLNMDVAIENTPLGRGFPHLLYVSHKICCFCPRFHAFRHVGMQQDVNWKESMSLVKRNNNHPLLQAPTFDPRPSVFSGIYISKYLDINRYIYIYIQRYNYISIRIGI